MEKISYCELDTKGMGYNFDGCINPDSICTNCPYVIINGKIIK